MGSPTTFSGHILLVAVPAWGHLSPLCDFACKVVRERPDMAVTFLTVGDYQQRVEQEIDEILRASESNLKDHIRLLNFGGTGLNGFELVPRLYDGFQDCYERLVNGRDVQCRATGKAYEAIRQLDAVIIDYFFQRLFQTIRSVTVKRVPVFAWAATNAFFLFRFFASERLGGLGDVAAKARTQAKTTGKSVEEITEELYRPSCGKLVTVPGLPTMYDHEWSPQEPVEGHPQNDLYNDAYIVIQGCDGIIPITSAAYEPESINAVRAWLEETNRQIFPVGPLLPVGPGKAGTTVLKNKSESENASEFQLFMDKMLESHGKNSLIYVSFGTLFWPKNEYLWAFVTLLLELGIPFIVSHAPWKAVVPDEVAEKIKESEIGLLSPWTPQKAILSHPVTGWIVTHCGQNGVTEALTQGIPMIAWPIDADQPANAIHATLTLDVAFELIEVRTGYGLKPLYRGVKPVGTIEAVAAEARDILGKLRGPEGERKRRNAEIMRDKLRGQWEEGGEALQSLQKLLTNIVRQ